MTYLMNIPILILIPLMAVTIVVCFMLTYLLLFAFLKYLLPKS